MTARSAAGEAGTASTEQEWADLLGRDPTGFMAATGLRLEEMSGSRVTGHLDLDASHHTPFGVVHGGVFAAAVETAASVGASLFAAQRGQHAVGVHNATDFLRAARGGRAEVEAVPLQQGRVQQLWLVTVTAPDGRALARGQVRLQNVDPRPEP